MGTYIEWVFDVTNVVAVFHRQHCYCLPSLDFRFREHEASPKIFDEKEKYLKVFLREGNTLPPNPLTEEKPFDSQAMKFNDLIPLGKFFQGFTHVCRLKF